MYASSTEIIFDRILDIDCSYGYLCKSDETMFNNLYPAQISDLPYDRLMNKLF